MEIGYARHAGLTALVEAAAWTDNLWALSIVGGREAVRGILSAYAGGGAIRFIGRNLPGAALTRPPRHKLRIRYQPIGRELHGIAYAEWIYIAREPDPQREAVWVSRQVGRPFPPEWMGEIHRRVQVETWNMVVIPSIPESFYDQLLEKKRAELRSRAA